MRRLLLLDDRSVGGTSREASDCSALCCRDGSLTAGCTETPSEEEVEGGASENRQVGFGDGMAREPSALKAGAPAQPLRLLAGTTGHLGDYLRILADTQSKWNLPKKKLSCAKR